MPQESSIQNLSFYRMLYKLFCFEQKVLSGKGTLSENDLSASLDVYSNHPVDSIKNKEMRPNLVIISGKYDFTVVIAGYHRMSAL